MQQVFSTLIPTWSTVSTCSLFGGVVSYGFFKRFVKEADQEHEKSHPKCGDREVCKQCSKFKPVIEAFVFVQIFFPGLFLASTAWGIGKWGISWLNRP